MVGSTLRELRERIAAAHEAGGRYYVSCGRTGERPIPVAGKRFPDRETAVEAAEWAASYRAELRRYDPRLPRYDLIVSESPGERGPEDPGSLSAHGPDAPRDADFCHDVAAAVFEALSAHDEAEAERAVMDAYLHSAESVTDPDDLCVVLLSTMAAELDDLLTPREQERVLRTAADRVGCRGGSTDPVTGALARFDGLGLVGDYSVEASRTTSAPPDDPRSWRVTVDEYAFEAADRLPTLPLVVSVLRRRPGESVAVTDARRVGATAVRFAVRAGVERPTGVVSADLADD